MTDPLLAALKARSWFSRPILQGERAAASQGDPLEDLTYLAKDLFDVKGLPTVAGSASHLKATVAVQDAVAIQLLSQAGARLVGLSNMDPLAYGFVTNNPLYGAAQNPHDFVRICGGSSGGSAGAVASGLVDFALGTDTSGSIRVPAAFTGVYGLKPTAHLFSSTGVMPLSPTLDRVGLFARSPELLLKLSGVLAEGQLEAQQGMPVQSIKVGRLVGYFARGLDPDIEAAVSSAAQALKADAFFTLDESAKARAAAYIIVAHEAAQTHATAMRDRLHEFDQETRARLVAAALIPAQWVKAAHAYAAVYTQRLAEIFKEVDLVIAPAVPCVAPLLADVQAPPSSGKPPLRATLGIYTQPISLTGYPVVTLPIQLKAGGLPTAIQLIAKPGADLLALEYAVFVAKRFSMFRPKLEVPSKGR